jgi:hypothetical protein
MKEGTPTSATMQFALEGGTETGSMLVFDPMSLPPEIDQRQRWPRRILEKLGERGALYCIPKNTEGWFTLRVFVDEPLPRSLEIFASQLDSGKAIRVKEGTLFFTGGEYAFHRDDSLLRKYPTMGGHESVPAGNYTVSLYALSYPQRFHDSMLEHRTTKAEYRVRRLTHGMGFVQAFLWVFILFLFFVLPWRLSQNYVLPVAAAALLCTWLLMRARAYGRSHDQAKAIHREFSDYAMVLHRNGAGEEPEYVI